MNVKASFKQESYKHVYGTYYVRDAERKKHEQEIFNMPSIKMTCAKNDFAACQILISTDIDCNISVGESPYFSAVDNRENLRIAVRDLNINSELKHVGSIADDDGLKKSDIILNEETVEARANEVSCMWLEIAIPDSVKSNTYTGEICIYNHRMFEPEQLICSMPFSVEVYDVSLPKPGDRAFYLDLWQHNSNIARKHDVRLWSDEHFAVIERYIKSLADLGQKAITAVVCEIPWTGQLCFRDREKASDLFEYSMVSVRKSKMGEFVYDYSVLKRYIELCIKHGVESEIEVLGLCNIWESDDKEYNFTPAGYPDLIRVRYYDETAGVYKFIDNANDILNYISALEVFFIDNGWIEKVRIAADEPSDLDKYKASVDAIKQAAPAFKYKAAVGHAEFMYDFRDDVSDFVPVLTCAAGDMDIVDELTSDGKHRMLWYVCCQPSIPNTYIRSHLLEARSIGWITLYLGVQGFLRWNYTVWPDDPRHNLCYRAPLWACGDTNFVYPANNGEPLLSLRYKALNRGICDYELAQMVIRAGGKSVVDSAYAQLIKVSAAYELKELEDKKAQDIVSLDFSDYEQVKCDMLDFLTKG